MKLVFALGLGVIIGIWLYAIKSSRQPTITLTAYNNTIVNVGAVSDLTLKKN